MGAGERSAHWPAAGGLRDWRGAAAVGGATRADWRSAQGCAQGAAARSGVLGPRLEDGGGRRRGLLSGAEPPCRLPPPPLPRPASAALPASMNRLGPGPVGSATAAAAAGQYRVCGNCRKVPRQVPGRRGGES